MKLGKSLNRVFSPSAEESKFDTGLRFTDILFGFVITQIFLRLQGWATLSEFSRWQLICATALVLGSWIGFRRSLHRSAYELKFFNIPFFRFLLDQLMLILYFRVATLTPLDPSKPVDDAQSLTHSTLKALLFVFVLYFLWDMAGQLMAGAGKRNRKRGKYPKSKSDRWAPTITLTFAVAFAILLHVVDSAESFNPTAIMIAATAMLIAYRWAKDIRSALK